MCSLHLELVYLWHSFLLCNVAFFYSFSSFPNYWKRQKNQIYPQKRKGKLFSLCYHHNESPLDKAHPFVCSSRSRIQYELRKFLLLHRDVSSSVWLSFQTYGEFGLPPTSWTCVNAMLLESHILSCFRPREVLQNLSRPFCIFSLVLMPSHLERPIKSFMKINEVLCLIIEILLSVPDKPLKTSG